jgi:hypothetical protein
MALTKVIGAIVRNYRGYYIGFKRAVVKYGINRNMMDPKHYEHNFITLGQMLKRPEVVDIVEAYFRAYSELDGEFATVPETSSTARTHSKFNHVLFDVDYNGWQLAQSESYEELMDPERVRAYATLLQTFARRLKFQIDFHPIFDKVLVTKSFEPFERYLNRSLNFRMWWYEMISNWTAQNLRFQSVESPIDLRSWLKMNETRAGQFSEIPDAGRELIAGMPTREMTTMVAVMLTSRYFQMDVKFGEAFSLELLVSCFCFFFMVPSCILSIESIRRLFWYISVHFLLRIPQVRARQRKVYSYDEWSDDVLCPYHIIIQDALDREIGPRRGNPPYSTRVNSAQPEPDEVQLPGRISPELARMLKALRDLTSGFCRDDTLGAGIFSDRFHSDRGWIDRTRTITNAYGTTEGGAEGKLHAWNNITAPWTEVYNSDADSPHKKWEQFKTFHKAMEQIDTQDLPQINRKSKFGEALTVAFDLINRRETAIIGLANQFSSTVQMLSMMPLTGPIRDDERDINAEDGAALRRLNVEMSAVTPAQMAMNVDFTKTAIPDLKPEVMDYGWDVAASVNDITEAIVANDGMLRIISSGIFLTSPPYRENMTASERLGTAPNFLFNPSPFTIKMWEIITKDSARAVLQWALSIWGISPEMVASGRVRLPQLFDFAWRSIEAEPEMFGWTPLVGFNFAFQRGILFREMENDLIKMRYNRALDNGDGIPDSSNIEKFYSYSNLPEFPTVLNESNCIFIENLTDWQRKYDEITETSKYVVIKPYAIFELRQRRIANQLWILQNRVLLAAPSPIMYGDEPLVGTGAEMMYDSSAMNYVGKAVMIDTEPVELVKQDNPKLARTFHSMVPMGWADRILPHQDNLRNASLIKEIKFPTWQTRVNRSGNSIATIIVATLRTQESLRLVEPPSMEAI